MDISIRSMLTASVTAVTASAIAIAPTVAPPPAVQRAEVALSAQVSFLAGQVSELPTVLTPRRGAVLPNAQVGTTSDLGTLSAGSGLIDLYNAVEPWVQWGFEVTTWVVGWVPVVGFFSGQIMVAYFTVEPLVFAGVQSLADLLSGNAGAIPGNIWNGVVTSATNFIQGEINWVLGFFPPWPPIPLPPVPPLPFAAIQTFNTAAPPDALGGPIGNSIVAASDASHAIWNSWYPVRGLIRDSVAAISNVLDSISYVPFVPLANFELDSVWGLGEEDALAGFANDMIAAGNNFVDDTVNSGLVTATNNAFSATVNPVGARDGQAIDTAVALGVDQLDYFTGIWTPHATGPAALRRTVPIPPALKDALRPLEVAPGAAEAQLQAGANTTKTLVAAAADLPAAVQKATDHLADIEAPGKTIRATLGRAFAAKAAQGKASGDSSRTALKGLGAGPANGLAQAVRKAVTGLQKASKAAAGNAKDSGAPSNDNGSSSNGGAASSNATGS